MSSGHPHMIVNNTDWRAIAQSKRDDREAKLRKDARIQSGTGDVTSCTTSGLLTAIELEIIHLSAVDLARHIADRTYTALQVATTYTKAATIAQDVTNCLTAEICFDEALKVAADLDDVLARTGRTVGPLHGVPISVKEHIDVKGLDGSSGFVGWCYKNIADKDAVVVRCLREAGAVIYCKTTNPQSLLVSTWHIVCDSSGLTPGDRDERQYIWTYDQPVQSSA